MGILVTPYPDLIARGAIGAHGHFASTIVEHQSGHETPNLDWPVGRGRWNVARAIEGRVRHQLARRHFYQCRGRYHRFLFKDWTDYECERTGADRGRVVAGVTGGTLQINKVYGAGDAFEYVRPIYRIKPLSEQVWVSGAAQTRGSDYTIDNATGLITAGWTPATVELSYEFYVLCRYDLDNADPRLVHRRPTGEPLIDWQNIDIVEVREEVET